MPTSRRATEFAVVPPNVRHIAHPVILDSDPWEGRLRSYEMLPQPLLIFPPRGSMGLNCTLELRQHITVNLANWQRLPTKDLQGLRQAAVALCVVDYQDRGGVEGLLFAEAESAALVLTRRSRALKNHSGQWALPGGRREPGEIPEQTALRELSEEVGLDLPSKNVIGCLDDFITRSGFLITPVVVWGGPGVRLLKNEHEVSSIHRIPCLELLRVDAPVLEPGVGHHPILFMPVGNSWIAAPTAAILFQFREVALLGRNTRVAHYDQPAFAWR